MEINTCYEQNTGGRRIFWTTRAEACGDYTLCGNVCSIPGLEYEDVELKDPYPSHPINPPDPSESRGRTIKTDNWLQGLILNILNTRSRTDMRCPTPAGVYGHWSESYRDDGLYIGSTLWNAAEKSYVRIADSVKAIGAAVRADMGKLIALGIATSVTVTATYVGSGTVEIIIEVVTTTGRSKVNLSGSFVSDTWVWQN
jgi:phage gp46-like protein